ncbi:oligosaccharide flippase family protein, partial [Prauserella halophila]
MNRERVARSGLISLAGGGTGAVFGLLLAVVVGRGLGPEDTGFFFQMIALFMIIANVGELGADTGLVRELARQVSLGRYADLVRTIAIAAIPVAAIGIVVLTAIWLFAPEVAQVISSPAAHPTTTTLIVNTIPFALLASLLTVLLGATRGLGGVLPFVGIINIGLPVARVVVVLIVLSTGFGLIAAARAWTWPLVVACAGAAVILAGQLSRMVPRTDAAVQPRTPTRALVREFWSFSAARGVAAALEIGLAWADVLLVAALLGPTEAGVYAIVSRAARAGLLVDTAMRMALSPRVSATLAVGDLAGARA